MRQGKRKEEREKERGRIKQGERRKCREKRKRKVGKGRG
jgi:hypothetical protein